MFPFDFFCVIIINNLNDGGMTMQNFNNIVTFVNNSQDIGEIPKELYKLIMFTTYSSYIQNIICYFPNAKITKSDVPFQYNFTYQNKNTVFSLFSNLDLQVSDKKNLKCSKRMEKVLLRTLKLACSMDLVNPRVVIGNSLMEKLSTLIIYQENGVEKILDYARNIVMNKDDYYELFMFKELNILDKYDLYRIYQILCELDWNENLYEYLLFSNEIFKDLSRKEHFKFLTEKYDINGINRHNYIIFGNDCDCLFFQTDDLYHRKYDKLIREVDSFTEEPSKRTKHISYNSSKGIYELNDKKFGYFTFDLLSNMTDDEAVKKELLSKLRYGKCHQNSNIIARSLSDKDKQSAYIVGGKFKENEMDSFYHSWVEIDEKNVVIDFNHNIVMNRDKYYKLYEVVPISKTSCFEMEEVIETILFDAELDIHPIFVNYFGSEMLRDLKKNNQLLRKSK